jgi:fused signal recognition particle receptor
VEYVYLIIAIVVVALAALVGLVTTRTRGRGRVERDAGRETVAPAESTDTLAEPELPDVDVREVPEVVTPTIERPESTASRLVRLRQRLSRSQGTLGRGLLALLSRERLDEDTWEDIEDTLLTADVGVGPTQELVDKLRSRLRVEGTTAASARQVLREELLALVDPSLDRSLHVDRHDGLPGVVLMVGVNGTGKTTSLGKLAWHLRKELGQSVLIVAADTYRAAATEQLERWAQRAGCDIVTGGEGQDPGSVAFDGIAAGIARAVDVVLVDTAGRLHTQDDLMAELGKVRRVIGRKLDGAPHEVLLTVDATTGQNGLRQARLFSEAVDVSGIVLTKLDGTAKGGIALAIAGELGLPVKLIGTGEQLEDLRPFDPSEFARALIT